MKNLTIFIFSLFLISSVYASGVYESFTGDKKLACEAILCLSTGSRPAECRPSIKKFFSIHGKKPWKTIQLRKQFLELCPNDNSQGIDKDVLAKRGIDLEENKKSMNKLEDILIHLPHECTAKALNRVVESKKGCKDCEVLYRISPYLPQACVDFAHHKWTDIKLPEYKGNYEWTNDLNTLTPVWFSPKIKGNTTLKSIKNAKNTSNYSWFKHH
ncbi:hypothetical protein A6A19_00325 [Actinobacillus delphinicola]|uniref:TrbM/KikA/MpfK family conjugal transfer protein n=1 Tax=Actinobacillus delphinicola TaxID=51161 RepID=UPI00244339C2|nr:TrbM/KikA/MpfK family conjugal transfer protein [Actinobacillus delphinicola]MDG6896491.1 hypothetical protein [Actinobacillus delphinicola]